MSRGVGGRSGSDLAWLWLWWRPAAVALIGLLVWEPPYAAGTVKEKERKRGRKDGRKGGRKEGRKESIKGERESVSAPQGDMESTGSSLLHQLRIFFFRHIHPSGIRM